MKRSRFFDVQLHIVVRAGARRGMTLLLSSVCLTPARSIPPSRVLPRADERRRRRYLRLPAARESPGARARRRGGGGGGGAGGGCRGKHVRPLLKSENFGFFRRVLFDLSQRSPVS